MDIRELTIWRRTGYGKERAKKIRREGRIPAILYGGGVESLPISVNPKDVTKLLHAQAGGTVLLTLRFADGEGESRTAIIRDLQFDPVTEDLIHADLQQIRMDQAITVSVPIQTVGEAAGVKEQNGVLSTQLREVEVACLPNMIPNRIVVDVAPLRIHDVITVKDLKIPEGVRILGDPDRAVVTVAPPMVEEVVAPAAAAPTEPEVLTERKEKTEEEEKEKK